MWAGEILKGTVMALYRNVLVVPQPTAPPPQCRRAPQKRCVHSTPSDLAAPGPGRYGTVRAGMSWPVERREPSSPVGLAPTQLAKPVLSAPAVARKRARVPFWAQGKHGGGSQKRKFPDRVLLPALLRLGNPMACIVALVLLRDVIGETVLSRKEGVVEPVWVFMFPSPEHGQALFASCHTHGLGYMGCGGRVGGGERENVCVWRCALPTSACRLIGRLQTACTIVIVVIFGSGSGSVRDQ